MLTVVMPNFNHSLFLPHAFRALLAQTRRADELIVIDDASTDDSISVIESFLSKHRNAVLLRNEKNLGAVRCMNIGLCVARGSELVFAAADDVVYPTFFERAFDLLRVFPNAAFASGRTEIIDADGNPICVFNNPIPLSQPGYICPRVAARELMRDDGWFTGNVTMFNKGRLSSLGGFPEDLGAFTDGFVSRVLALKHGACFTPEVLGGWRRLPGGMASSQASNWAEASRVADSTVRRMHMMPGLFPARYPERWRGRHLFGALRFALVQQRKEAREFGVLQHMLAFVREVILTTWHFAVLRPQDVLPVMRRRLWC